MAFRLSLVVAIAAIGLAHGAVDTEKTVASPELAGLATVSTTGSASFSPDKVNKTIEDTGSKKVLPPLPSIPADNQGKSFSKAIAAAPVVSLSGSPSAPSVPATSGITVQSPPQSEAISGNTVQSPPQIEAISGAPVVTAPPPKDLKAIVTSLISSVPPSPKGKADLMNKEDPLGLNSKNLKVPLYTIDFSEASPPKKDGQDVVKQLSSLLGRRMA